MSRSSSSGSQNRLIFALLLIVLIWAPLPFASNVLWAELLLCLLCFALTTGLLISRLVENNHYSISRLATTALWLLTAAQAYVLLQLLLSSMGFAGNSPVGSIEPMATAVQLLSGIALCCVFYLVVNTVTSAKRAHWLLMAIILSGIFQASYATVMTLSGLEYSFFIEKSAYRGVATGTFINRNHLAGYLVLTLACGIGLMLAGFKPQRLHSFKQFYRSFIDAVVTGKGALRIGLVIMVIGLVLTRSRMGNGSFFIGLALAGTAVLLTSRVSKKTIFAFIFSIFVIDALIIGAFFDLNELAARLESTAANSENRDEIFRLSLPMVADSILFGTGAGSFYTNYPAYRDASAGGGFYMHAHNDYVEFVSERGLIGVLPLALFVLLCARQGWRLLGSSSMKKKGLAFTIIMSVLAILMHSTVDFNLQMPAYALTLIAVWALAFTKPYEGSNISKSGKRKKRA